MKIIIYVLSSILAVSTTHVMASTNTHDFAAETITGETVSLGAYAGNVLVIVNTASRCGFTRQYAGLVELQEAYAEKGVVVIGFPSGNFGGQELGSNEEIAAFCEANFGVNFPLMAKTNVRGRDQHPLFAYLTSAENPDFTGSVRWNFEKFIVDQTGVLRRRFRSRTGPDDPAFREAIDQLLQMLPE